MSATDAVFSVVLLLVWSTPPCAAQFERPPMTASAAAEMADSLTALALASPPTPDAWYHQQRMAIHSLVDATVADGRGRPLPSAADAVERIARHAQQRTRRLIALRDMQRLPDRSRALAVYGEVAPEDEPQASFALFRAKQHGWVRPWCCPRPPGHWARAGGHSGLESRRLESGVRGCGTGDHRDF